MSSRDQHLLISSFAIQGSNDELTPLTALTLLTPLTKFPFFFGFALEIPKDYALLGAKAWRAVADSRFESSAMIPSALEPVNLYPVSCIR